MKMKLQMKQVLEEEMAVIGNKITNDDVTAILANNIITLLRKLDWLIM